MKQIGTVKVSTWRFFNTLYAYTLHSDLKELQEAADRLRAEGWTVTIGEFEPGVWMLEGEKHEPR